MKNLEKTKNQIRALLDAWSVRNIGNTTLMMEGVKNYDRDFMLVGVTKGHASDILRENKSKNIKTTSLDILHDNISVSHIPVVVDHAAMSQLLESALHHLLNSVPLIEVNNQIEKESARRISRISDQYDAIIDKLTTLAEKYQTRCHRIERLSLDLVILNFWEFKEKRRLKREILKVMAESMQDPLISELFEDLKKLVNN